MEDKEEIRRAYYIKGKSIRQIHRETGHHRHTIRKALEDGMKPEYSRRKPPARPVMAPVMAPVDFGEAEVIISGEQLTAQIFCLRMCYSKQAFVMALPNQSQESFFEGHVRAFCARF